MNIIQKSTPHFQIGRRGYKPEIIVIHIMDGSLIGTDSWFNSPISQVSAHYGIGQTGEIHQYVKEENESFHAGVVKNPTFSLYKGAGINPNWYTIGIEHEGKPDSVWSPEMIKASVELIKDISKRWNIPIDRDHIIGHYQIRSTKPNCPAFNKSIIDSLVELSKPSQVEQAIVLLEQAIKILKT